MEETKQFKVVFPFVEAGLGHIMPMRAIADAFERKYGGRAEVVRLDFFRAKGDPDMKFVEDELIREVKLHNSRRGRGSAQFFLMRVAGARLAMKYLMAKRYGRGFEKSLAFMRELDADLIFNTHFSTLYYACEAKRRGWTAAQIVAYCPDPVLGLQWDSRADLIGVSGGGKARAEKTRYFKKTALAEVPFLIRSEIKEYTRGKAHYRRELGLPEENFTILLADGAYGAGKLRETVLELLKSPQKMTLAAVCGKNEALYREFCALSAPDNITFKPYGFTDKTLALAAAADLFVGKAGASNLAEPAYFGVPAIVTFCATPIEKWICAHYTAGGAAVRVGNAKKAAALARSWAESPDKMSPYIAACARHRRADGAEVFADLLWERLTV
ncbi:MAG: hypothetical protein LBL66_01265 [Clostridiales bacterium]|jgi:UDP-N-acetylglucosamine:LPS N-acetylglucosamine transferase|nr:hypothetical protein [Clostridiales bacterium]